MSSTRPYRLKILLLAGDVLAFVVGLLGAAWLRFHLDVPGLAQGSVPWGPLLAALPYATLVWVVTLRFTGLYRLGQSPVDEGLRLLKALTVTLVVLAAATFFQRDFEHSRAMVLIAVPIVGAATLATRTLLRFVWHRVLRLGPVHSHDALVIGTGPIARHLVASLAGPRSDYRVCGIVATHPNGPDRVEGVEVVGTLGDLDALLRSGSFQTVLVADAGLDRDTQLVIAEACLRHGRGYHVVPDVFELMLDRVEVRIAGGLPMLGLRASNIAGTNALLKRVFDVLGATAILLLASPVMLATAIGIKLSSSGPVFFSQERVGLNGRSFRFLKFRSMHVNNDDQVHREYVQKWMANQAAEEDDDGSKTFKLTSDPRIFPLGHFIRKYSIDELPQLFNVLRGDMSLIGPRPPIPYEVEAYREWHRRRFETLPGITGLWQVSGRNRLSFDEMVQLDIEYIENWSLRLDARIALRTVGVVLSGSDAY